MTLADELQGAAASPRGKVPFAVAIEEHVSRVLDVLSANGKFVLGEPKLELLGHLADCFPPEFYAPEGVALTPLVRFGKLTDALATRRSLNHAEVLTMADVVHLWGLPAAEATRVEAPIRRFVDALDATLLKKIRVASAGAPFLTLDAGQPDELTTFLQLNSKRAPERQLPRGERRARIAPEQDEDEAKTSRDYKFARVEPAGFPSSLTPERKVPPAPRKNRGRYAQQESSAKRQRAREIEEEKLFSNPGDPIPPHRMRSLRQAMLSERSQRLSL